MGPEDLERHIGYHFQKPELLQQACTHPSLSTSHRGIAPFERLEFLGDRVLALVIVEHLYKQFPSAPEGMLAHRLARLVCRPFLADVMREGRLSPYIHFSGVLSGQEDRVLADACEALIGALYLDGGLEKAQKFIMEFWKEALSQSTDTPKDPKSRLQEWTQGHWHGLPLYLDQEERTSDGQVHFTSEASLPSLGLKAESQGRSKKAAQSQAAEKLWGLIQTSRTRGAG